LTRTLVLFDGVCVLCNGFVDFLLPRDANGELTFGALQSEAAKQALRDAGLPDALPQTVIVIDDGRVYQESTAVLRVFRRLGWPWRALSWLRVVPRPLRDAVYRFIAKRRYRLTGRRDSCRIPNPAERARFLL
jgi:predicted DCC family thiol-disulfide oxidoreductase YuxK